MTPTSRTATPARLASIAAVLAILAALVIRPALAPVGARAMGPLPACRYDDILTTPRGYADWAITQVDTILRVPQSYVPPDLVSTSEAGIAGGGKVRAVMIDDLRAMSEAAAAAGNGIGIESAYRSYASQESVFNSWVKQFGYKRALQISARPGHSEHQLGLAIDFRSEPGGSPFTGTWNTTPAGKWMKAHAWEYGFVMSYPKDSIALTCYDFEPWHFRYVGRDVASAIHASGLTQRQYLWANFTTTVVPPAPKSTKPPVKTPVPTSSAAPASPSLSPTIAPPAPSPTGGPLLQKTPAPTPIPASPAATPGPTEPPIAPAGVASAPMLVTALAVVLALVAFGLWVLRRRGRSGVGL